MSRVKGTEEGKIDPVHGLSTTLSKHFGGCGEDTVPHIREMDFE